MLIGCVGNSTDELDDKQKDKEIVITGKIMDASMNTLTIEDVNGVKHDFNKENADTSEAQGLFIGAMVSVSYDSSSVEENKPIHLKKVTYLENYQVIEGGVVEYYDEHLTLMLKDNQTLEFQTAALDLELNIGDQISVLMSGNLETETDLFIHQVTILKHRETEFVDSFAPYEQQASAYLKSMSLEEKVGQVFLVRCPEPEYIDQYLSLNPAGLLLFGRDFKDKDMQTVIDEIQSYQDKSETPLLIAVDEEGGSVVRVSSNPQLAKAPFKSPSQLYAEGGFELIYEDAKEKSNVLNALGINVNLAPVADIATNSNAFIYNRTIDLGPTETATYVEYVVKGMKESGLSGTLKHFPGYGNNVDTHTGIAVDNRDYETFVNEDFLPFKSGVAAGVESILVSHNIVNSMDSELPASLSSKVHQIIRDELEFTGVIMTDDLTMGAITSLETDVPIVVLGLQAGNDLMIVSDFVWRHAELLDAFNTGTVSEEQLDTAVLNVLKWKFYMGLLPIEK
ncbi:MAG TPA: beta-hexosaminidase [Firmicutes bacterium]|nr:beta-hexosaminidase [Bacillota bacterium]